jgi:hypothetical protein
MIYTPRFPPLAHQVIAQQRLRLKPEAFALLLGTEKRAKATGSQVF